MNPALWTYLGFVVAILILIWAAVEVRSRFVRRKKADVKTMQTWIPLDSGRADAIQEEPIPLLVAEESEQEEEEKSNLHIRAQQNGHYSPSKKL